MQGAGRPFNMPCAIDNPSCGDLQYGEHVCFTEYVLYIGKKENYWKMGISRYFRNNIDSGFLSRLVEQGFQEVVIFRSKDRLNLITAQKREQKLSLEFNIPLIMTKIKDPDLSEFDLRSMAEKIVTENKDLYYEYFKNFELVSIYSPWIDLEKAKYIISTSKNYIIPEDNLLFFRILATWGNRSLIQFQDQYFTFDRSLLLGRQILFYV